MATKDELLTAFQENYEILVSYATAIAGNRENALDVVQTLAVKLLETDGREVQTPLAFLYAMTRRVAIDMYRHEKHSLPLPPDWMHRYGAPRTTGGTTGSGSWNAAFRKACPRNRPACGRH